MNLSDSLSFFCRLHTSGIERQSLPRALAHILYTRNTPTCLRCTGRIHDSCFWHLREMRYSRIDNCEKWRNGTDRVSVHIIPSFHSFLLQMSDQKPSTSFSSPSSNGEDVIIVGERAAPAAPSISAADTLRSPYRPPIQSGQWSTIKTHFSSFIESWLKHKV